MDSGLAFIAPGCYSSTGFGVGLGVGIGRGYPLKYTSISVSLETERRNHLVYGINAIYPRNATISRSNSSGHHHNSRKRGCRYISMNVRPLHALRYATHLVTRERRNNVHAGYENRNGNENMVVMHSARFMDEDGGSDIGSDDEYNVSSNGDGDGDSTQQTNAGPNSSGNGTAVEIGAKKSSVWSKRTAAQEKTQDDMSSSLNLEVDQAIAPKIRDDDRGTRRKGLTQKTKVDRDLFSSFDASSPPLNANGPGMAQIFPPATINFPTAETPTMLTEFAGRRVSSYCTAQEYRMRSFYRMLSRRAGIKIEPYDEVLHAVEIGSDRDVFVFPYGVVVMWGMESPEDDDEILESLKPFERSPLIEPEYDGFEFIPGDINRMTKDVVSLVCDMRKSPSLVDGSGVPADEERQDEILERLAISHAFAQSVRLTCFEDSVQKTIAATRHLPEEMARNGGMISKSRSDISKFMGRLITDRHNVFLYADVLDTPEFFWENERFEFAYRVAERYLELRQRAEALNRRVEVVRDLFELLGQELQFKHSSDLEMIVIALIAFEILITLIKDGFEVLHVRRAGGRVDFMSAIGIIFVVTCVSLATAALLIFLWKKILNRMKERNL